MDYDSLEAQGLDVPTALDTMRGRAGLYDPEILAAFTAARGGIAKSDVREIPLRMVQVGMTFAADVKTATGVLLVPRGYEVTLGVLARIRNFSSRRGRSRNRGRQTSDWVSGRLTIQD